MNQRNANRLKQKGTASLSAWDFKSRDTPKEVPMAAFDNIPRQTEIMGQPHALSYINPEEEAVLQKIRGGMPPIEGPGGVPAFWWWSSDDDDDDDEPAASSNDGGWSFSESLAEIKNDFLSDVSAVKDYFTGSADTSTSFADEVLSGDSSSYLPGGGAEDTSSQLKTIFDFQSNQADNDPYGTSTASGVITSSGVGADIDTDTGNVTLYKPGETGGVTITDPMFNFGTGSSTLDLSGVDWDALSSAMGIDTSYADTSAKDADFGGR
jgi:hypothetical protein